MTLKNPKLWLDTHPKCECERDCHFMPLPGENKHAYGKARSMVLVETPLATMAVCLDCAATCLECYPRVDPRKPAEEVA